MPQKPTMLRACEICGQTFLALRSKVEHGGGRFCSRPCFHAYRRSGRMELTCATCGTTFSVPPSWSDQRYCSRTCSDAQAGAKRSIPLADRFWQNVDKNGPIPDFRPDLGPCWLWTRSTRGRGYGQAFRSKQDTDVTSVGAHVVAYELMVGPIPDGLHLDHLCRVIRCCRPSHLESVTGAENHRRGAYGVLKTHCVHGHAYTPDNTEIRKSGSRRCRECARKSVSKTEARQHAYAPRPRNA